MVGGIVFDVEEVVEGILVVFVGVVVKFEVKEGWFWDLVDVVWFVGDFGIVE